MIQHSSSQSTETGETQSCPQCQTCEESQETENTSSGNLETPTGECLADLSASNSSLLEFYNEVMTFNATDVNVTCCNLDGTPMSVTCGQGLSCAASCFSLEATLCPSHNCEACGTFEDEEEGQRRGWSYVTQASSALAFCPGPGHWCNVWRTKGCCFHPVCQRQKQKECSWLRYFVGRC